MHTLSWWRRYRLVLLAALGIFFLKALWLWLASVPGLVMTPWIIDDTYINVRVARNVARGMGYSFNGIDPTNGTPFLWTYLTAGLHILFPLGTALKATFLTSAFFGMLSSLVSFAIGWKVTGSRAGAWTAFVLTALTGNAFLVSLNGMDTAFFTFWVLLAVALFLGVGTQRIRAPFLAGCALGFPVGIALLTRADALFLAAAMGLCLLGWLWQSKSERRQAWQYLLGFCVVAGVCFAASLLWSYAHVGALFPANQVGRRAIAWDWHAVDGVVSVAKYFKVVGWNVFVLESILTIAAGSTVLAMLALCTGFFKKETRSLAVITALYCGLFFLTIVGYQWYFMDFHGLRYINPPVHLLLILVAALLVDLFRGTYKRAVLVIIVLTTIALSWYSFYTLLNRSGWGVGKSYTGFPTQQQVNRYWPYFQWAASVVPHTAVVGVRDHGRFALFTDLPVQDLSGVLDPVVTEKLHQGGAALREYLRQKNVQYLFIPSLEERSDTLFATLHQFVPLEKVAGAPPSYSNQTLYKIQWDEPNP